jgi:hypothetical protein
MTRSFAANVGKFNAKAQRGEGADKSGRTGMGGNNQVAAGSKWIGFVRRILWTAAASAARRRFWIGPARVTSQAKALSPLRSARTVHDAEGMASHIPDLAKAFAYFSPYKFCVISL